MRIAVLLSVLAASLAPLAAQAFTVKNITGGKHDDAGQLVRVYFRSPQCTVTVTQECGMVKNTCGHMKVPEDSSKSYWWPAATNRRKIVVCYTNQAPRMIEADVGGETEKCVIDGSSVTCH